MWKRASCAAFRAGRSTARLCVGRLVIKVLIVKPDKVTYRFLGDGKKLAFDFEFLGTGL
jgi:hypothetical protein